MGPWRAEGAYRPGHRRPRTSSSRQSVGAAHTRSPGRDRPLARRAGADLPMALAVAGPMAAAAAAVVVVAALC